MQRMHAARWQDSGPQWQLSQDITFGYCSMPTSIGCWPRTRWCPSGLVELPDFHAHVMSQLPRAASGQKALWSLLPLNTFPRLFHKVRGVSLLKSVPQDWLSAPSFLQFYPSPCSCYRGQSHFTATDEALWTQMLSTWGILSTIWFQLGICWDKKQIHDYPRSASSFSLYSLPIHLQFQSYFLYCAGSLKRQCPFCLSSGLYLILKPKLAIAWFQPGEVILSIPKISLMSWQSVWESFQVLASKIGTELLGS